MKQNKTGMMRKNLENEIGIIEIPIRLKNSGWKIIGGIKKWIRNCPVCNTELYHVTEKNRNKLERDKTLCRSCSYKYSDRLIKFRKTIETKFSNVYSYRGILKKNISGVDIWTRSCPECKSEIFHKHCPRNAQLKMLCRRCMGKSKRTVIESDKSRICHNCKETVYRTQKIYSSTKNQMCRKCWKKECNKKSQKTKSLCYKLICSVCKAGLFYKKKSTYLAAEARNSMCHGCSCKTNDHKQKLSRANTGVKRSDEFKENVRKKMLGRKITWGDKISKTLLGRIIPPEQEIKRLESRLGMNYDEYIKRKPKYFSYKSRVMSITRRQQLNLLENCDKKRTLAGQSDGFQLDHIITIRDGFEHNINPHIVGNIKNLRFIPWEENLKRNRYSGIVIKEHYKQNILNDIEEELLHIYSKYDNRLYKIMSAVTEKWYENPNLTVPQAMQIAKSIAGSQPKV